MITRFSLVRKRPELSPEEFLARWTGEHIEIAKRLPGLRGYVIHVLDGEAPPYDGIADGHSCRATSSSSEARARRRPRHAGDDASHGRNRVGV